MNPYVDAYLKCAKQKESKVRRCYFSRCALAMTFLLLLSFLMVYKHTLGQRLLISVQHLTTEQKRLDTERSVLLGQRQAAFSRPRVISYAREKIGLDFPDPERIHWIRVNEGKENSINLSLR